MSEETKIQQKFGLKTGNPTDVSPVIGEAVWVFGATSRYADLSVSRLRDVVFEPIFRNQCIVFQNNGLPCAAVFWALRDETWTAPSDGLAGMSREDWTNGTHPVVVDVLAPFGDEAAFTDALMPRLAQEINKRSAQ